MNKKRITLARSVFIIFFLSIPWIAPAQKWERWKEKAEKALEDGKYRKAHRKAGRLERKTKKKLGTPNPYLPFVEKIKAEFALQEGRWLDFEGHTAEMLAISQEVFDVKSEEYAYQRFQLATLWAEAGFIRKAYEGLQTAKDIYQTGEWPESTRAAMTILEAGLLTEMGQYTDALRVAGAAVPFMQSFCDARGLRKKEKRIKYRQWAAFVNTAGKALLGKGDVAGLDSVMKVNEAFLHRKLSKNDWVKAELALIKARMQENINKPSEAIALYEEAFEISGKKRRINDKRITPYSEALIHAYYRLGETREGGKAIKEYAAMVTAMTGRNSFRRVKADLLKGYRLFYEGKYEKAEKIARDIGNDKSLPRIHPLKLEAGGLRYKTGIEAGKFEEAYQDLYQQCEGTAEIYGRDGAVFHLSEMQRAAHLFDYTNELGAVEEIIEASYDAFLNHELEPRHTHFVDLQNQLIRYYRDIEEVEKALALMEISAGATRMKANNSPAYGRQLVAYADLLFSAGKLAKSVHYLQAAAKVLTPYRYERENVAAYAGILFQKARMMKLEGNFDQAEDMLDQAEKFVRRSDIASYPENAAALELLADMAQSTGKFSEAERLLTASIDKVKNQYGADSRHTMSARLKLARLYLVQGNYKEAGILASQLEAKASEIYGKDALKPVSALLVKADISAELGDYKRAAEDMEKGLARCIEKLGSHHLEVARIYAGLSLALLHGKGDKLRAGVMLDTAMRIVGEQLGTTNPAYADLLVYKSYLAMATGRYPVAFRHLFEAEEIYQAKSGKKNNVDAAVINVLAGDIFYRQRNYKKARQHYEKSMRLYGRYFNESHMDYVKVMAKISRVAYMEGNKKKAIELIETVMRQYEHYLQAFFPILSERQKARFWNMISEDYEYYNSLVLKSVRNYDDKKIGNLYDNAINTKALLLNSSIRLRKSILSSGNEKLISNFNHWLDSKEMLARVLMLNPAELADKGIRKDSLIRAVEGLEKQLVRQSDLFESLAERRTVTWQNVKESLKEGEVAVEMIRFRYFDHVFTDSVIYAALILHNQHKRDKPEIVVFNHGNALENQYFKGYKNSMTFKIQDNTSYQAYWQPMEEKLRNSRVIYLSPAGVYNQININAVPCPDGRYLVDKFNIRLISNTKDIYLRSGARPPAFLAENNQAVLFGDPEFYTDVSPKNSRTILPLPGTHAEVQHISGLFRDKGWNTVTYLESAAREEQLKEMSEPGVFHIATHGFYAPAPENTGLVTPAAGTAVNPLLRSGLMLSGAGDIMRETSHNYNIENGILTAYEAMNLNLSHTSLVVLSACETGVGEVQGGEGVYGLPRAFLIAGAPVLIMSLFKVNDAVTQLLMTDFYSSWLKSGNIRESFASARNRVREEYPDPIYWGAFVVFGLEQ